MYFYILAYKNARKRHYSFLVDLEPFDVHARAGSVLGGISLEAVMTSSQYERSNCLCFDSCIRGWLLLNREEQRGGDSRHKLSVSAVVLLLRPPQKLPENSFADCSTPLEPWLSSVENGADRLPLPFVAGGIQDGHSRCFVNFQGAF